MHSPIAWQAKDLIAVTAVTFALYVLSYFVVWALVTPLQQALLPQITAFASLLFLPHGVRVFATSLAGGRAVPGLVLGELAGNLMFWGPFPSAGVLLAVSLASGSVTWLAFEGLRALRIHAYYLKTTDEPPAYQHLLLAGIMASVANAFLVTAILEGEISGGSVTRILAAFVTGDITGLLAVMLAAPHVLRFLAARSARRD